MNGGPDVVCDVVVIGGGPAGAAASGLLASWGHDTLVLDRPAARPAWAESLPPSCVGLLNTLGVRHRVDAAGFVVGTGNTAWWGGGEARVEPFPSGRTGWQVDRARFDAILREHAVGCGARWWRPATGLGVEQDGEGVVVRVEREGRHCLVRARWVVDASGRAGLVGRHHREMAGPDWRTIALAAPFERPGGWGLPDESHTLVESREWGWGWSVPVTVARRYFTAMFNPSGGWAEGGGVDREFMGRLAALPHLGALSGSGVLVGPPFACDATTYRSSGPVEGRVLMVGDAASFLDPLSSFGVKKALASAWMAAVAIHTAITTPGVSGSALGLFEAREASYGAGTGAALASVSREAGADEAFWAPRAALEADEAESLAIDGMRHDPAVSAAFAALRAHVAPRLREGRVIRTDGPIVRGNVVRVEPHLRLRPGGAPMRFLRNVDVVVLVGLVGSEIDVGDLVAAYLRVAGEVPLPDLLGAVSVLVAYRVLEIA